MVGFKHQSPTLNLWQTLQSEYYDSHLTTEGTSLRKFRWPEDTVLSELEFEPMIVWFQSSDFYAP